MYSVTFQWTSLETTLYRLPFLLFKRRCINLTSFYSWCWPFSVWGPLTAVCVTSPTPRTNSAQLILVSTQSFLLFFFLNSVLYSLVWINFIQCKILGLIEEHDKGYKLFTPFFIGSSPAFNIGRSRWSWSRCFQYPWIQACQRLFGRPRADDWLPPNSRSQTLPPQNIWQQQQPINRQPPRRIPQQHVPGNVPFQAQTGFGHVPDITHIQPVCNVSISYG